jgi:hypothetical protein
MPDGLQQKTFLWVPRLERRAGFAAFLPPGSGVEAKTRLVFLRSVTFDAFRHKNRPDMLLEEIKVGLR